MLLLVAMCKVLLTLSSIFYEFQLINIFSCFFFLKGYIVYKSTGEKYTAKALTGVSLCLNFSALIFFVAITFTTVLSFFVFFVSGHILV